MLKAIKFVIKGSLLSFLTIVTVLMLIIWVPSLWGWSQYRVSSYSMYPTLAPGNIILVKPVEPSRLRVGDIITFKLPGESVNTHRVSKLNSDGTIQTKGDANPDPDRVLVKQDFLIGKVVFRIPLRGR